MTSLTKEDLLDKVKKYLYTSASDPIFMEFLYKNGPKIRQYLEKHQLVERRQHENLSQKERIKLNIDRYVHAYKLSQEMNQFDLVYKKTDYIFTVIGLSLNTAAFLNTIEMLGDENQAVKWRKQVTSGRVFGGYGQTELGHGSNVQGLETEAHYDEKKQTWTMKSPSVTSAKFWPGVLGLVATHSVVQAKAFVKGKSIGVQTFVIEIRDQNLNDLKGVESGDIGPKFGFHRVDNGYVKIQSLQLPRDSLLMRYIQVTPDGEVIGLQNKAAIKYAYGSMLFLRVALPFSFAFGAILASARNLQGLYEKMGVLNEPQYKKELIDYFSVSLGIGVANCYSKRLFESYTKQLNAKNFEKADKILVKTHITSATFKALASWKSIKMTSQMATRNVFTTFRTTGLPDIFNNAIPSATYEGDNSVLLQQTARFILVKDKGEDLAKPETKVRDDDLQGVIIMLKYVTSMEVRRLKKVFGKEFEDGVAMKTFWNQKHQRDIIEVSKLWGVLQFLQGFADSLKQMSELKPFFTKIGKIFIKNLLVDVPQVYVYGFQVQEIDSWKQFTEDDYWALTHYSTPLDLPFEEQKILERKGTWLRSKL